MKKVVLVSRNFLNLLADRYILKSVLESLEESTDYLFSIIKGDDAPNKSISNDDIIDNIKSYFKEFEDVNFIITDEEIEDLESYISDESDYEIEELVSVLSDMVMILTFEDKEVNGNQTFVYGSLNDNDFTLSIIKNFGSNEVEITWVDDELSMYDDFICESFE